MEIKPIDIKIDLNLSTDAQEFYYEGNEDQLVHKKEFERVRRLITARVSEQLTIDKNDEKHTRRHNVISVLGERGTGKTSFLLSVKEFCSDVYKNEVQVLKIIDPTLIEEKGHVFLNIVSLIADAVDDKLDKSNCDPRSTDFYDRTAWNRRVESLAHGLPSLDGIGSEFTHMNWQDPEYIMQKGIRAVSAARKLEDSFNDLIRFALRILEKKVFLLILDDIDVSFTKGWPVLETLRKYLTSPQVITLLSGDLKLFSLSVRKQQWKNFGKALLINEAGHRGKHKEYNAVVTELEGQYLRKVLKPELRVHLTNLGEKLRNNERRQGDKQYKVTIIGIDKVYLPNPEKNTITDAYDGILKILGVQNSYQAEAYRSYLLSLPLRTQIRLLSIFKDVDTDNLTGEVIDVFLSELYDKKVQLSLIEGRVQLLSPVILDLLIRERQLSETYQLQPITTDDILNACLITLNFTFSNGTKKNPFLIFDYFIKIGYLRNLVDILGYQQDSQVEQRKTNISTPSIEGICKHAGLLQDKVLRDSAGLMLSYLMSVKGTTRKGVNQPEGSIQLHGRSTLGKRGDTNRIDRISKESNLIQGTLINFPVSIFRGSQKQDSKVVYSIYTLFGAISELIRKAADNDLDNGLLELSQMREYNSPDFNRSVDDGNSIDTILDDTDMPNFTERINPLKELIYNWIREFNVTAISPHLLGKISTRMFYAFSNITSSRPQNAGEGMYRMVMAVMNSVLVEEAKENLKNTYNINLNNPTTNDTIFLSNLRKLKQEVNYLPFSRWIISCPILQAYLSPKTIGDQRFLKFVNDNVIGNTYHQLLVYDILSRASTVHIDSDNLPKRWTNQDFYDYCVSNGISYAEIMNAPPSEFENIFRSYPWFFNVGRNDTKLRNFRRFVKSKNLRKW